MLFKKIMLPKNFYIFLQILIIILLGTPFICSASTYTKNTIIPILTYHKFCLGESPDDYTINIDRFEQQLIFLKNNGYQAITVSQLLNCIDNGVFPEKPVLITIDDGFKSAYTQAFPLLKKYQIPATFYLYVDFINNGPNQLSWIEVEEMIKNGMEIGSHSISHCNLLHIKTDETYPEYLERIRREIFLSKSILERKTNSPVNSFAYPYGVYSEQIRDLAIEADYQVLLNVNSMNNSVSSIDQYNLNRYIIAAECSLDLFKSILEEKPLEVKGIFPADGTVTDNQSTTIGVLLKNSNISPNNLNFRLSGSGLLDFDYSDQLQEISFTPVAPKLLQKRTWIAQISTYDRENDVQKKYSWLFTIR